jgi:hypothetical protein
MNLAEDVLPSIEGVRNVLESFSPLSPNPRSVSVSIFYIMYSSLSISVYFSLHVYLLVSLPKVSTYLLFSRDLKIQILVKRICTVL